MAHKSQEDTELMPSAPLEAGKRMGIVSKTRFPSTGPFALIPPALTWSHELTSHSIPSTSTGNVSEGDACVPALLRKACDLDVVKRSSLRKGRVLAVFADYIKPVKGGKLGTICNLDSDPYMDVAFPEGVMRFLGSFVFPANKYLSLNVGKKEVVCEDVFDSILLFCEVEWLPEGDASRKRKIRDSDLDLPSSLLARRVHAEDNSGECKAKEKDATGTGSDVNTSSEEKKEDERPTRRRSQPRNVVDLIDSSDESE